MASPVPQSQSGDADQNHEPDDESNPIAVEEAIMPDSQKQSRPDARTPEPGLDHQPASSDTPSTPGTLTSFDWEDFEVRYEKALRDADENEEEILKQAGALSKYFKVWAAAASAHDDERAAKRLQTRRRFVNLSEENMAQKQQHYDEVDDLFDFHKAHFSQGAVTSFGGTFMDRSGEHQPHDGMTDDAWEEEDHLGYYDDGVKRTLTDEQIEIFRHSELEALRKEQEKQSGNKAATSSDEAMELSDAKTINGPPTAGSSTLPSTLRGNKKKKKKGAKRGRPEPKPDLRKRTWDVVDKGLDSLDYD
ncbi:hypothetical protein G7Z17_g6478 [Cylindrodendrum hubeiense]|uniref:Uncharacterized protein n=1 Tax=Cylindrodendrum hubeiense TaxID=595255 RepID=A0A9P5LGA6_9HYPO|nr:hypothetical protein G7Z17_g6478 [Cylindrodendrum hubeiense]